MPCAVTARRSGAAAAHQRRLTAGRAPWAARRPLGSTALVRTSRCARQACRRCHRLRVRWMHHRAKPGRGNTPKGSSESSSSSSSSLRRHSAKLATSLLAVAVGPEVVESRCSAPSIVPGPERLSEDDAPVVQGGRQVLGR